MAGNAASKPFGLAPVKTLFGVPYSGKVSRYRKEASVVLGIGDAVVLTGSSSTAGTNGATRDGIPLITRAAAGSGTITGVVVGFEFDLALPGPAHNAKHMAAADKGMVLVADDPYLVFHVQEDSDSSSIAVTGVGEAGDLATIADANTTTGYSTMMLDSSNVGTGDQLQVLGLADIVGNELGGYSVYEVLINEHTYKGVGTPI